MEPAPSMPGWPPAGELRTEHGWSLDELSRRSGLEPLDAVAPGARRLSPTAALLGRLCTVYERTMSRLLTEVEAEPPSWCAPRGSPCGGTRPPASCAARSLHRTPGYGAR